MKDTTGIQELELIINKHLCRSTQYQTTQRPEHHSAGWGCLHYWCPGLWVISCV